MSELGRLLTEARSAKGLNLADVESVTRIRQKYLEALEHADYDKLPRGTVARGFLRTYAAYLGLDAQALLDLYGAESGDAGEDVEIAEPGSPRVVDYRPLEVELIDDYQDRGWVYWLVAALVVALLAAGAWWLLGRNSGWNPLRAFAPAPVPTATSTPTATPWVVTATPRATATLPEPPTVEPMVTSSILTLPTPTVPASPTPTSRPTSTPEIVSNIFLELIASQRSWLRVVVDGAVVEEGFVAADDTRAWEADDSIVIRTGNAGGLTLILNGEDLGPMGNIGQVVERGWVVGEDGEVVDEAPLTPGAVPTAAPTATPTATPAG